MLELYHWEPNGAHLKPLIALKEKSLDFLGCYVDLLAFEQYGRALPALAPESRLNMEGEGPILVHEGTQITESCFMMIYLEDAFPGRLQLQPSDPHGRWRILAWARFINEVFMPAVSTLGCAKYLAPALAERGIKVLPAALEDMPFKPLREAWRCALENRYAADQLEDSRRKIALAVERIERALASEPWIAGPSYSLADIDAFAVAASLPLVTPELVNERSCPRTFEWMARIRERPAVRDALACSRTGRPLEAFVPGPEHSRWG
jgi:glutathione S-transferase